MGANGVGGTGDVKWTKALFDKLDVKDGKPADGKIEASIWNGFLESIGSKGNTIEHFITFERAEKSFEYYMNTKDKGAVDWSNPDALLEKYEQDVAAAADGEGPEELTAEQRAEKLKEAFGEGKEADVQVEAKATGIGKDYPGKVKLPNGAEMPEEGFPEVLFMSLPDTYGENKYMKLTLMEPKEEGIYETTAHNRQFKVEVGEGGKITMKAYNTEELEPKLKADQIKYGTRIPVPPKEDDAAAKVRKQAQANINASVDFLAEVAYKDPKPEITDKKDGNGNITSRTIQLPDPDKRSIMVYYDAAGKPTDIYITASKDGVDNSAPDVHIYVEDNELEYDGDHDNKGDDTIDLKDKPNTMKQILELVEKAFGSLPE